MSSFKVTLSSLMQKLMKPTPFFGIKLWLLITLSFAFLTLILVIIFLSCILIRRRRKSLYKPYKSQHDQLRFPEIILSKYRKNGYTRTANSSLDRSLLLESHEMNVGRALSHSSSTRHDHHDYKPVLSGQWSTRTSCYATDVESAGVAFSPGFKDAWRKTFSLMEIEIATNGLAKENVIGNGDYGTVYRGILFDGTRVAVKKLLINSCQAEEFIAQVETVGHVRHKNLVNLLGYCMEGPHRMLVYEYVDNKNLQYWLREYPKDFGPLTWRVRMNIIRGIAKGLAYLHDDVDQKILHGSLKASNVLLDHQWNPKIADFGLARLFGPQWGFIIMEALGYMPPENYASPRAFTEKKDVYSFGILIMEIITGRSPIERYKKQPYLVEWLKSKVAKGKTGDVLDPSLAEMPCSKEFKRLLLVALRCVDLDEEHRPTMGHVIHMLEPRDLLLDDEELLFLSM